MNIYITDKTKIYFKYNIFNVPHMQAVIYISSKQKLKPHGFYIDS